MSFWSWFTRPAIPPVPPPVVPPVDNSALTACRNEVVDLRLANLGRQQQVVDLQDAQDALKRTLDDSRNAVDILQVHNQDQAATIAELQDIETGLNEQIVALTPTLESLSPIVFEAAKEIAPTLTGPGRAAFWWDLEKSLWLAFAKPSIEPFQEITPDELKKRVMVFYPDIVWSETKFSAFSDSRYRITTVANLRQIFEESYAGLVPYIAELHDCDDFSREFAVHLTRYTLNSCLSVWGQSEWGGHAWNLVVCSDGLVMIEPQMTGDRAADPGAYFKVLPQTIDPLRVPETVRDI